MDELTLPKMKFTFLVEKAILIVEPSRLAVAADFVALKPAIERSFGRLRGVVIQMPGKTAVITRTSFLELIWPLVVQNDEVVKFFVEISDAVPWALAAELDDRYLPQVPGF
jgi:hypothetical protein